jgi:hypothetical protein
MGSVEAIVDRVMADVDDGAVVLIACAVVAARVDARDGLSTGSTRSGSEGERRMLGRRADPTPPPGPNDGSDAELTSASPERA